VTDSTPERKQMRITGLHHVTLICRNLQTTTAFYRDLLGLGLVNQGVNEDDEGHAHFWFGDPPGVAGTMVSFMEYPDVADASHGAGTVHHFALTVDSIEELAQWKAYLEANGVGTKGIYERGQDGKGVRFSSLYLRDPDGNILELATRV
jgi:catechol 2,3-dioxygenase-like lactoylglutathione lyase family enzyme